MKKRNGSSFYPSYSIASVYDLDFQKLYEKGYRALFLTLTILWFCMTLPQKKRLKLFSKGLGRLDLKQRYYRITEKKEWSSLPPR